MFILKTKLFVCTSKNLFICFSEFYHAYYYYIIFLEFDQNLWFKSKTDGKFEVNL